MVVFVLSLKMWLRRFGTLENFLLSLSRHGEVPRRRLLAWHLDFEASLTHPKLPQLLGDLVSPAARACLGPVYVWTGASFDCSTSLGTCKQPAFFIAQVWMHLTNYLTN